VIYSATLMMAREAATGLTEGHDDVRQLFETLLRKLD